ncbi:low affinity immunoglobulin gamma Fc region receptor III-B-like [Mixophyes fleayi]|uniref:low affinity immunoglobulin gamma Fc region receptor III-B-like n=1 Tax=Mixophyes fleayi TaxID=3061075 RepID=UPI003F4D8AF5
MWFLGILIVSLNNEESGAAVRPVVIFSPNYYNIFVHESVTITCNTGPAAEQTQTYYWYKDNKLMHRRSKQSFKIESANDADSGDYQCRTSTGDYSHPVRLDVSYEYLILQRPPSVYEGDPLTLRCHSVTGFPGINTVFYKDGEVIQSSVTDSVLHIDKVDKSVTGTYRCTRQLLHHDDNTYHDYSAESKISVLEKGFPMTIVIGVIIGLLVVVFLISALLIWKRRSKRASSTSIYQGSPPANTTADDTNPSVEENVCYTYLDIRHLPKASASRNVDSSVTYAEVKHPKK